MRNLCWFFRWTTIAKRLPGRTDTGIKNFWNNCLKKKISKKETPSLVNLTPLHQLLETADLLTCAVNDLRDEVLKLHSDASFTWYPRHGHGFHPTDEELILTSLPPLPPQTPSFHYQQAIEPTILNIYYFFYLEKSYIFWFFPFNKKIYNKSLKNRKTNNLNSENKLL